MGKKESPFAVNALVFAKVKGYPAWPAKVTKVVSKNRFSVYFYGTGETGIIKQEDLFPYLESKEKFINDKIVKRAHFQEALNQIEAAVSGEGDPAPISTHNENGSKAAEEVEDAEAQVVKPEPETSPAPSKGKAQQQQKTDGAATKQTPKQRRAAANNKAGANNKMNQVKDPTPPPITPPPETQQPVSTKEESVVDADAEQMNTTTTNNNNEDESPTNATSRSGRKLKPKKYLLAEVDLDIAPAPVVSSPTTTTTGTKRKLTATDASPAIAEAEEVVSHPAPPPPKKVTKGGEGKAKSKAAEKKAAELHLKEEVTLIEMNAMIKTVLGKEQADVKGCIRLLERFQLLNLTPLMLLKNPTCVETIKRCRRYVGNVQHWGYTPEQAEEFKEMAQRVRELAEEIYQQIKKLFVVPDGMPFWTAFNELSEKLLADTNHLVHEDFTKLYQPPESIKDSLLMTNSLQFD